MIYLAVTIDVEPDCSPSWNYSDPLTFHGVQIGIKDILQPLFNKYGIVPTYLINNVVLEDKGSIEVFKNLQGKFELGTHLHPEFIEPMKTVINYAGSKGEANSCFYEPEIEFEKLQNITNLFFNKFGYYPTSFRAGRFSAGLNTFNSLVKLRYKVDTSVTPHVNWNDRTREREVNYTNESEQPYWIARTLLEVPVTIRKSININPIELVKSGFGIRRKINFYNIHWLRPVYSSKRELNKIIMKYKKYFASNNNIYLNMMFHNVEILPKLSPYCQTEKQCKNYLEVLESFFSFCNKQGICSTNLSKIADIYE